MEEFAYSHIALLGNNTEISIAEIEALLGSQNVEAGPNNTAYINTDDGTALMARLGGTIKISTVDAVGKTADGLPELIAHLLSKIEHESKLLYGISAYPISKQNENLLKKALNNSKKLLKSQGIRGRYINKGPQNPHTAQILQERLLKKGAEINIFKEDGRFLVGKTVGLQDINSYSFRDFKRPARDAKSGMLPPKFAQMLINMAHPYIQNGSGTIYDPFCGSGTVLQEAKLMGYEVTGSDLSEKAIKDSKKNMSWFDYNILKTQNSYDIFKQDATKASEKSKAAFTEADAIVCEGYLGPPLFKTSANHISRIHDELIQLYNGMFKNIAAQVKNRTPLVIALPFHHWEGKNYFLKGMKHDDWQLVKNRLLYRRDNQIVGREIWTLLRK